MQGRSEWYWCPSFWVYTPVICIFSKIHSHIESVIQNLSPYSMLNMYFPTSPSDLYFLHGNRTPMNSVPVARDSVVHYIATCPVAAASTSHWRSQRPPSGSAWGKGQGGQGGKEMKKTPQVVMNYCFNLRFLENSHLVKKKTEGVFLATTPEVGEHHKDFFRRVFAAFIPRSTSDCWKTSIPDENS